MPLSAGATVQPFHRAAQNRHDGAWGRADVIGLRPDFCLNPGADIRRVARDLQNCAAQADLLADFRLLRATQCPHQRTNRLRRDLARNIAAYPAFLPILLSLQEGLFCSLYLARFSRNQR